jgi:hypothetical protein
MEGFARVSAGRGESSAQERARKGGKGKVEQGPRVILILIRFDFGTGWKMNSGNKTNYKNGVTSSW